MFFFILCSVFLKIFYLLFELHFLIHLEPLMHLIIVHIFCSLPHSSCFICLFTTKRGRVYRSVYRSVSSFLYNSCAHSQGEKFYLMHIRKGRNPLGKCMYQGREDFSYKKTLFCLFYIMCFLVFLYCALSYI